MYCLKVILALEFYSHFVHCQKFRGVREFSLNLVQCVKNSP